MSTIYTANKEFSEVYKVLHIVLCSGCYCCDMSFSGCIFEIVDTPNSLDKYLDFIKTCEHKEIKILPGAGGDIFTFEYIVIFEIYDAANVISLEEQSKIDEKNSRKFLQLKPLILRGKINSYKCMYCKMYYCNKCFEGYEECINCGLELFFNRELYKFLKRTKGCSSPEEFNLHNIRNSTSEKGVIHDNDNYIDYCSVFRNVQNISQCPICDISYCSNCYLTGCPLKCL